jgi:hypothetical protein
MPQHVHQAAQQHPAATCTRCSIPHPPCPALPPPCSALLPLLALTPTPSHHALQSKLRSISLLAVERLLPGQNTAVFQRYPIPSLETLSFSILYR